MTNIIRCYSELIQLPTFEERFEYLKLDGMVGADTFGFDRFLNQAFYKSYEWKQIRRDIILRDMGCDLGCEGFEIYGKVLIHHMNPISPDDILRRSAYLMDPEFLICVSHTTHNAIHYGDKSRLVTAPLERSQNDTCPWKH